MKQSMQAPRTLLALLLSGLLHVSLARRSVDAQALDSKDGGADEADGPKGAAAKPDGKRSADILNIYTGAKKKKRTRKVKTTSKKGQPAAVDDEAMAAFLYPHAFQRMQQGLPVTLAGQGPQKVVFQASDNHDLAEGEGVEEELMHDPLEAIERDTCCIRGSEPSAEHATDEGTYEITVMHSGLSLKYEDGHCQKSLPSVQVTYLCPAKCYLQKQDGEELMAYVKDNPDSTVEQFERCDSHGCDGICYNPNDGRWYWEAVVSVDAPRLNDCTVLRGGPQGGQAVMDSNCVGSFEAWRQAYQRAKRA